VDKTYFASISATGLWVSTTLLIRLLANTSGATSLKMCSVARRRSTRPIADIKPGEVACRCCWCLTELSWVSTILCGNVVDV
jgi:hypothetical protein